MSGHSKWASIKHKKGAADAKRGKVFSRIVKEIAVAARTGGGSTDTNPRLRVAIGAAKAANMPNDNIQRAIKRGTGELPGVTYEEISYEGYGPFGVAILVDAMTDNKNRTTAEIRNLFAKKGGNMSGSGSVAWQFQRKGLISLNKEKIAEDKIFNITIEAGADDFNAEGEMYEIITSTENFEAVKNALAENKIDASVAEITSLPTTTVKITDENQARKILSIVEAFEEHEDVQHVYANFDISDEILNKIT